MQDNPNTAASSSQQPDPGKEYAGPERRQDTRDRIAKIEQKVESLESLMRENTDATKEIRDLIMLGKSLFRFAGWVGSFVKWLTIVGGGVGGFWAWMKSGHPMPPGKL